MGPQVKDYIEDQEKFVDALSPEARSFLKVRGFHLDSGWNEEKRWKEFDPQLKICTKADSSASQALCGSRLSICTYNATTVLENLASNFPTVIFWNPNFFELRDSAQPYYDELRKAGILHDTPESAAAKVNEVYEDPMAWWSSPEVQMARENFCQRYAWIGPDWISDWKKEFKNMDIDLRPRLCTSSNECGQRIDLS
jgi:putative transferase (TIGR04331 family)